MLWVSRRNTRSGFSYGRSFVSVVLSTMALSALAVMGVNCGSGTAAAPCDSVYAGQCGSVCATDFSCPTGLYCGLSGSCTADCATGAAQCAAGQVCSSRGKCIPGDNSGSGGADGNSSSTGFFGATSGSGMGPDACADVVVKFEKQVPTVMLLIDQSGSMTENFGNGNRWNVLYQTLMNANTGIVKTLQNDVRFGLALYTSNGGNAGGVCPMLAKVPLSLANFTAIDDIYKPQSPKGDTPTGESISAVAKDLVAYNEPGPKVIVLATDGEPDTCAVPNPQNGQPESIKAAQDAYGQNIKTFVISVGSDVSDGHLQDVANAGAGLPVGGAEKAKFYKALDPQALVDAFDAIINGVRSCVLKLNGTVDAEAASAGKVSLDGMLLGYDDPNGWRLNAPDEIELLGTSCETIKDGDHLISVEFPCGIVVPK